MKANDDFIHLTEIYFGKDFCFIKKRLLSYIFREMKFAFQEL